MTTLEVHRDQIPDPPAGYGAAVELKYPSTLLLIVNVLAVLLLLPVLGVLTWWLQGRPADINLTFGLAELLLLLAITLTTVIVHELIHGSMLRLLGYRVSYGVYWQMAGIYVAAFQQFITRNHNLVVAIAPLIVFTVVLVPLLALPQRFIVLTAFAALLINTSGAVGDIYLMWRLARLPAATLMYDVSIDCMLIYPPETDELDYHLAHEHE